MLRAMIIATAAVGMGFAAPALAQQGSAAPPSGVATPATPADAFKAVEDMRVYSAGGERVGEVERVVVDGQGSLAFVVEIEEGFLGMTEKDVLVPMDSLMFQGDRFQARLTEEEMKALQEWD
ncbi:PRC-barrel domain-containing protein [Novispirillum sp. DQ9]|uniref:PRC-barrel domain-containing protein n=1 Tax=Novispirillum sp. DQ9 TaxID=3398612 RepID=UPI003C7C41C1